MLGGLDSFPAFSRQLVCDRNLSTLGPVEFLFGETSYTQCDLSILPYGRNGMDAQSIVVYRRQQRFIFEYFSFLELHVIHILLAD